MKNRIHANELGTEREPVPPVPLPEKKSVPPVPLKGGSLLGTDATFSPPGSREGRRRKYILLDSEAVKRRTEAIVMATCEDDGWRPSLRFGSLETAPGREA